MDLSVVTTEQLKTLYNRALASARTETRQAQDYRAEIEAREPRYQGRSREEIASAVSSLYTARTFAGTPHDLPESDNPFRAT